METTKEKELEKLEVINKIKLIAEDYDLMDKMFKLQVVTEGTCCYQYEGLGLMFVLEIMADNDFFREETLEQLLSTERIDLILFGTYETIERRIDSVFYSKCK